MLLRGDLPELRWRSLEAGSSDSGRCPRGVERLGGVPVEELASLHRTAACLVSPDSMTVWAAAARSDGFRVSGRRGERWRDSEVCWERPSLFDPGDPAAIANAREALAPADELYDLGIAPPRALHVGEMARESDAVDRP